MQKPFEHRLNKDTGVIFALFSDGVKVKNGDQYTPTENKWEDIVECTVPCDEDGNEYKFLKFEVENVVFFYRSKGVVIEYFNPEDDFGHGWKKSTFFADWVAAKNDSRTKECDENMDPI